MQYGNKNKRVSIIKPKTKLLLFTNNIVIKKSKTVNFHIKANIEVQQGG